MSRKIFLLLLLPLCIFYTNPLLSQQYQGFNTSNFSGITGIYENPANLGDNRYIFDINFLSGDFNLNNNYIAFSTQLFSTKDNPMVDSTYWGDFQGFRNDHFFELVLRHIEVSDRVGTWSFTQYYNRTIFLCFSCLPKNTTRS